VAGGMLLVHSPDSLMIGHHFSRDKSLTGVQWGSAHSIPARGAPGDAFWIWGTGEPPSPSLTSGLGARRAGSGEPLTSVKGSIAGSCELCASAIPRIEWRNI
jgi:hypothetical protein